jgi:uncharacterized membrane protein
MRLLEFFNLFGAGLLAGIEFAVRFGVRGPLTVLDERPQIQIRQALIKTLRLLVPAVYVPTFLSGILLTIRYGTAWRWVAVAALLAWTVTTFAGTVPLNQRLYDWDPDAPPADWRAVIQRWHLLDTIRTWAALLAFASFLTAVVW